ncbi:uncharacterized protein F5891DRAFT_956243 [Suillus fuscotomentosus]|uniref:Heterokaryon incompatibility domain-containing protein n=1 Tax=Suillus fuscotomentosus TaxID=1912939 RepID=A0AAD4E1S6_9AGAM|nr:uncharacterized protein F5891DRAFT_956243 [Suillus fuscotomentosus]KAG1897950.1 hypothetical protein F5891DRAFT_956243 [Suillus fuscotomentosus]
MLGVAFSPDGLKLACASSKGYIDVRRTDNLRVLFQFTVSNSPVRGIVWSPNGQQLVSISHNKLQFWNSSNGHQIGQASGRKRYNSLAISSDGSFIATASNDKTVRLWCTKTHQQIGEALDHTVVATCVAISPDAELLVNGGKDGKVQVRLVENVLSTAMQLDSSYDSYFAHWALGRNLYRRPLSDAEKVIENSPSSYLGYEMKHKALHAGQRYDEAIEALDSMLSKLNDTPDPQIRQLHRKYVKQSKVDDAIRGAVHTRLESAPLRLLETSTGYLCNREAQIRIFMKSTEYKKLLYESMIRAPINTESINKAVAKFFGWVMLSHRWDRKEPLLHNIQGRVVYELNEVGGIEKLRKFCRKARDLGYRWAWSDTCCIDQENNVELQRSVNSMFVWYHQSALTIVYLSDVPPSAEWGALANSDWNTRGWTVQEFLAPRVILFYRADWAPYLNDHSDNHKKSAAIMQELENSTGINTRALVAFRPGMRDAREKLKWVSTRVTTLQEDIVYSLFGIFGVHLPVIYGETKQNALGRLLQEIVGRSGDITVLDWVGKASDFNSCLPADVTSYEAPPFTLPSLLGDVMRRSVSKLRNTVAVELASKLYTLLDNLSLPRFTNYRLQLPCIAFPVTKVRQRHGQHGGIYYTYDVEADGLQDLLITTENTLTQFSPAQPTPQKFFIIRPWDRHDLGLPDFSDDAQRVLEPPLPSQLDSPDESPGENEPNEMDAHSQALRLIVRLGQPFAALLVAQQRGWEYKRIASDYRIIACVKDMASIENMMDVRMLEML